MEEEEEEEPTSSTSEDKSHNTDDEPEIEDMQNAIEQYQNKENLTIEQWAHYEQECRYYWYRRAIRHDESDYADV
jgi:hypothetical protein